MEEDGAYFGFNRNSTSKINPNLKSCFVIGSHQNAILLILKSYLREMDVGPYSLGCLHFFFFLGVIKFLPFIKKYIKEMECTLDFHGTSKNAWSIISLQMFGLYETHGKQT